MRELRRTEGSHPEGPTMVHTRRRAALAVIFLGAGLLISLGARLLINSMRAAGASGAARLHGNSVVVLEVYALAGADPHAVSAAVRDRLPELRELLPPGMSSAPRRPATSRSLAESGPFS